MLRSFQLKFLLFLFAAAVASIFPQSLYAYSKIDKPIESDNSEKPTLEQGLIEKNIAISNWLNSLTNGIDVFLVGKQLEIEKNETIVKIENSTYTKEGESPSNQTVIIVSPRFPNFEKYWNLKFSTYDDQAETRSTQKQLIQNNPRETNYGASIGLIKRIGKVRTSFQPRIELQNPLKVSHSLAFETLIDWDFFQINPKLEFFANPLSGTGVFNAINFKFDLSEDYALILVNEGTYEDKFHKYTATNGFSLGKLISDRDALRYNLLFISTNRDNYHLESYSISASWFHVFYHKILDSEITPHLDFIEKNNFKGELGLTLRFIISF